MGFGAASQGVAKYVIAKNDSSYIVIPYENADKTSTKLKAYFADPVIQKYTEKNFRFRATIEKDIYDFVKYINGQE
jgi:hypothetical protein